MKWLVSPTYPLDVVTESGSRICTTYGPDAEVNAKRISEMPDLVQSLYVTASELADLKKQVAETQTELDQARGYHARICKFLQAEIATTDRWKQAYNLMLDQAAQLALALETKTATKKKPRRR